VFFNLPLQAEPFAAVLIAHRTYGHSQKFVVKFEAESREGGSWKGGSKLRERFKLPHRGSAEPQTLRRWTHKEPRKRV